MKKTIAFQLAQRELPEGYELRKEDVGKTLAPGFGEVLPIDVGKKVYYRSNLSSQSLFRIENSEQRDRRKKGKRE